jgi:hypothetical protein
MMEIRFMITSLYSKNWEAGLKAITPWQSRQLYYMHNQGQALEVIQENGIKLTSRITTTLSPKAIGTIAVVLIFPYF